MAMRGDVPSFGVLSTLALYLLLLYKVNKKRQNVSSVPSFLRSHYNSVGLTRDNSALDTIYVLYLYYSCIYKCTE